ncbi:MAG: hypothetical protein IIC87_08115, partial [Chloroflexi bacterium]|nr:hypothetical protein [Chloroflexota bacterium]
AHAEAASASAKARSAQTDVKALEDRLDRTLLACEAMWMLLRKKLDITDEELAEQITELDLSDGALDGKVRKTALTCPKCKRKVSPRFDKCMYCETPIQHDPFA